MRKFMDIINEGVNEDIIGEDSLIDKNASPAEFERDDEEFYTARDRTGFFGEQAAGCIVLAKDTGRLMLVHRSKDVDQPFTWGNLGGAHKASERPVDAAQRELYEETGYTGQVQMVPLYVFQKGDFRYSNFLALVPKEFTPHLGWEATDFKWVEYGDWPQPLHFGPAALFSDAESIKTIQHYIDLCRNSTV